MAKISHSAVIWGTRTRAIIASESVWVPKITGVLQHASLMTSTVFLGSSAIEDTMRALQTSFTGSLFPILRALFYDTSLKFIPRRGEFVQEGKAVIDPSSIPDLAAWTQTALIQHVTAASKTTMQGIREILTDGLAQNLTKNEIVRHLKNSFEFSPQRAHLIARSELLSAANATTHFSLALEYDPRTMTKSWLVATDSQSRPSHMDADKSQVRIPFNDPFLVGTSRLLFPGDSSLGADPRETIGCRCHVLYYP